MHALAGADRSHLHGQAERFQSGGGVSLSIYNGVEWQRLMICTADAKHG